MCAGKFLNGGIEAAHASEARGERDFAERKTGFVDQLFCEVQAACLRDRARGGAEMADEEAAKMARADSDSFGQTFDAAVFQAALADEAQGARHSVRGAEPGGRARGTFGAAA